MNRYLCPLLLMVLCCWFVPSSVAEPKKSRKPLDHESYDIWNTIRGAAISNDGQWVHYQVSPGKGAATLHITPTEKGRSFSSERGTSSKFTWDSKHAIYLIQPDPEEVKKAKKEKKPAEALPKNTLEILELGTGKKVSVPRVQSFRTPEKAGGWVAYLMEKPIPEMPKKTEKPAAPKTEEKPAPKEKGSPKKPKKKTGNELVVRNLGTGAEHRFANVVAFRFTRNGKFLAMATSSDKPEEDGVAVVTLATSEKRTLLEGRGNYRSLVWDEGGNRLAFLSDRDDFEAKKPSWAVYGWRKGEKAAQILANEKTPGMPKGWWVASSRGPSFSKNGKRLFLGTAPKPEPEPKKPTSKTGKEKEEEKPKVNVDIWHWKDSLLQPMQLLRARQNANRSYQAVVHLGDGKLVQLADENLERVTVGSEGNAHVGVANHSKPHEMLISWDTRYSDVYLVDVRTGKREKLLEKVQGSVSLSPESKYLYWYDPRVRAWFALPVRGKSREPVNLSKLVPHPVHDELHDRPAEPSAYGAAGWVEGDTSFLIYDKHDIWAVDPKGKMPPACVTDGFGRKKGLRFRYSRLDVEKRFITPDEPMLLSAFHLTTKASGFYRDRVHGTNEPEKLVLLDEAIRGPGRRTMTKAKSADRFLFTRSTFQKFPDLWVSDINFEQMRKVSDANPQQKNYSWGSAELVDWNSLDGTKLQGVLYKPEDFDPKKKYPLLVYFYERLSHQLHRYVVPAPGRSSINISFYVSRGYVVFTPDIPYRVGQPGQSCLNAVLPGVTSLIDKGFIDKQRIGVQGHSWGGYQIAYLVTRTNLFAAAEAGAPVSNMTSAYGGIRWGSGMSRMFQYEKTQSRIGGTLWDAQQKYVENSPVFWADRVQTPLLMLHNDKDGAVPWYQGIEMFVALRRLGKPCWLVNYNGADHGLTKDENKRDWTVRMQQFFDHYLEGAPAPVWLATGIPAQKKGKTLGLDLVDPGGK